MQVKRSGRGLVLFDLLRSGEQNRGESMPKTDVRPVGPSSSRIAT